MDDVEVAARAVRQKARRDLLATVEQLRFEGRERVECVVCGAEMQAGRCPWAKLAAVASADGLTYCAWPRAVRTPTSGYRFPARRR